MESKKRKCPAYKHSWKKWSIAKKKITLYSSTMIILQQWVSSLGLLTQCLHYNCASCEDTPGEHGVEENYGPNDVASSTGFTYSY